MTKTKVHKKGIKMPTWYWENAGPCHLRKCKEKKNPLMLCFVSVEQQFMQNLNFVIPLWALLLLLLLFRSN